MKTIVRPLWSLLFACLLLANSQFATAATASDTETLLNWAERTYPDLFPSPQGTQTLSPWIYRFYPETEIYAGVNTSDLGVYLLGGVWTEPTYIDSLANLIGTIEGSGGNASIAACDNSEIPEGFTYSQSGNVVTVSTNGACIAVPTSTNICEVPEQNSATGISVLNSTTVSTAELGGITLNLPDNLPFNPFEALTTPIKTCTINAPEGYNNTVVNADICVDVTSELESSFGDIVASGFATVNPPVTYTFVGTTTNQVVSSCFETDADSIVNTVTGEVWNRVDGSFVQTVF